MAFRTIEIDANCDIQAGDPLLEDETFQRVFKSWKRSKDVKDTEFAHLTVNELKQSPEAAAALKAHFNRRFVRAVPEVFTRLMKVVDTTEEMIKMGSLSRVLADIEIVTRFEALGVNIEAHRNEKERFYREILGDESYKLEYPPLTEEKMQLFEAVCTKETGNRLQIVDFDIPFEDKLKAYGINNETVRDSIRLDRDLFTALRRNLQQSEATTAGAKKKSFTESIKYVAAMMDAAEREGATFVIYSEAEYIAEDSFADTVGTGLGTIADFELLLEKAAFHRFSTGKPLNDFERPIFGHKEKEPGFCPQTHITGNLTADGKKVLVLEGDPSVGHSVSTVSPNRTLHDTMRQEVTVMPK